MSISGTEQAVLDYLAQRGHCYQWNAEAGVAHTRHWGTCGCYGISLRFFQETPILIAMSRLGIKVQFDDQPKVLHYLTRVNHGLVLGTFEMDFDDGEIRCRISHDHEGTALDAQTVKHIVHLTTELCDHYIYGLLRVLYGDADPEFEADRADQEKPWD
jgi:hypothetical protein